MTPLSALIARVEEGAGPDRHLDAKVCILLNWVGPTLPDQIFEGEPVALRQADYPWDPDTPWDELDYEDAKGESWTRNTPNLTASLDAVLSLIEQKLPGWSWKAGAVGGKRGWCAMCNEHGANHVGSNASSPARALLAATLRALSALEDSKADLADATNGDRS